jgi:hypothetical protein
MCNCNQDHQSAEFCPGFSECLVFSAGMKIVVAKNLENTVGNVFEGFLTLVMARAD